VRRIGDNVDRRGFTLVEIMIALAILGILVVLAVGNFQGMMEKYRVEGETKQMFADLMDARARAMQRNRVFFVQINSSGSDSKNYKTYEDTSPSGTSGDGSLGSGYALVASATVQHPITWNSGGVSDFRFNFDRNGIASVKGFIRFVSTTAKPDYDCITVQATRIKMGQYNATVNCVEK
jgi:prepilin-type N-terminal cleavage/methylation domain-containing protein